MENRLPEVGELWTWLRNLDGKEMDHFLVIGEPTPIPKIELMGDYKDPYGIKVMWVYDGDIGNMIIDRTDMHNHIRKVA
jgi:hypothetical protein